MAEVWVRQVSHQFSEAGSRPIKVLDDVNLHIGDKRIVVVIGRSGCGKTTLLKLIAGFIAPTQGTITIDDRPIRGPAADRGVVFQGDALYPWLTVRDNVAFSQKLRNVPKKIRRESADYFLDLVGLSGFADHRIWQISGGMRQRVGLARSLNANPEVLLMDEPFGALDALTREEMQELILKIWRQTKKTIFLITHGIEEAVFLATDLVVMSPRPGRIKQFYHLGFGHRFIDRENARTLKASREFVTTREEIATALFERPQT
jgi:taurine transport system ATP-binding protein